MAVAGREDLIRNYIGMGVAEMLWSVTRHKVVHRLIGEHGYLGVEQRDESRSGTKPGPRRRAASASRKSESRLVFLWRALEGSQVPEVIANVQEYQNPFQFRSAGHCRRDSCRVAAVREKNQRLQQTVEGERSLVHGRGR
jgi:hypothetical protein